MADGPGVLLASLTTLRLGGPADELVTIDSEQALESAVIAAGAKPLLVLGGGSNLVVGDSGFRGVCLRMASRGVTVTRSGGSVRLDVAAGERWHEFVARAVDEGWGGVECLAGIPGLVGATPIQNVGAYGQQVSDTIESVRAFDTETKRFFELTKAECHFDYRTSLFKQMPNRFIVTRVRFNLEAGAVNTRADYAELARSLSVARGELAPQRSVYEMILTLRQSKGMVVRGDDPESVSAGSFFMNPTVPFDEAERIEESARALGILASEETMPRFPRGPSECKLSAAWLIERSGFPKGTAFGAFRISKKHSLALVHAGGGTTRELLETARAVRNGVRERFGVIITPEPVFVGCVWE